MKLEDMINTIQLGDCYELIKKMPDKSVDCVYIDIPYLYQQHGGGNSQLAKRKYKQRMELVDLDIETGIDYKIFDDLKRIMKNTNIFIWCSRLQLKDVMNYWIKEGIMFNLLVWCKTNPSPTTNNTWLPDLEYCLYFRDNKTKLNNGYELKSQYYISGLNVKDKELFNHPTIKPLELVKRHLLHSTQENDIVLDCFCGSGTTCVAAKETGRRYIGIEIDPEYHRIAVNRLNGITANGQTSIFTDFDNL